ncbi:host nuclease inhibitor GamL [Enterobacter hormaechei]|uniref:host nuclease inhibitor GamL n=1 Tax=Enterobacter hormaechei TaxID=158836 RepID=UPI0023ECC662|nr:host nuclease inhibitor GamL [Enterobacter hormaechei]
MTSFWTVTATPSSTNHPIQPIGFPAKPLEMSSLFLPQEAQFALIGERAEEAYNEYISACAYARAEEEWQRQAPCPF